MLAHMSYIKISDYVGPTIVRQKMDVFVISNELPEHSFVDKRRLQVKEDVW